MKGEYRGIKVETQVYEGGIQGYQGEYRGIKGETQGIKGDIW